MKSDHLVTVGCRLSRQKKNVKRKTYLGHFRVQIFVFFYFKSLSTYFIRLFLRFLCMFLETFFSRRVSLYFSLSTRFLLFVFEISLRCYFFFHYAFSRSKSIHTGVGGCCCGYPPLPESMGSLAPLAVMVTSSMSWSLRWGVQERARHSETSETK